MMAWTSPLPTVKLDPFEDLVIRFRDRGDVKVVDDEVLVAHVGAGAPWVRSCGGGGDGGGPVGRQWLSTSG